MYPNGEDPNIPHPEPRPALALAAAAVERALRFVVDRKITLASIKADQEKEGKLIVADINPATGKRSIASIAFSEELWGSEVSDYLTNIKALKTSDLDKIITAARKFSRATGPQDDDDDIEPISIVQGPNGRSARARIPLNYGDDADGEDSDDDLVGQEDPLDDRGDIEHEYDQGDHQMLYDQQYEEDYDHEAEDESGKSQREEDYDREEEDEDSGSQHEEGHPVEDYDEYEQDEMMDYEDGQTQNYSAY